MQPRLYFSHIITKHVSILRQKIGKEYHIQAVGFIDLYINLELSVAEIYYKQEPYNEIFVFDSVLKFFIK